jgi:hypothetical protein
MFAAVWFNPETQSSQLVTGTVGVDLEAWATYVVSHGKFVRMS